MRRVKSTSDLPDLQNVAKEPVVETIMEEPALETVSAPTSPTSSLPPLSRPISRTPPSRQHHLPQSGRTRPTSPLARSFSTTNVPAMAVPEQKIQYGGILMYLNVNNPLGYDLTIRKTYTQTTPLTPLLAPFIFEQNIHPGLQSVEPINRHISLGKEFTFALSSIQFIDPKNNTLLKEITGKELENSNYFFGITLQPIAEAESSTTTREPSVLPSNKASRRLPPRPRKRSTKYFHVSPGQSHPSSPSVLSPSQEQFLIDQSLRPSSTSHSSSVKTDSETPQATLSNLPTNAPSAE